MQFGSGMAPLGQLIGHFAMGLGLGLWLSLTLILGNAANVYEVIVNSSEPSVTMATFVGVLSSISAIGATLTGLIFITGEDKRRR